MGITLLLFAGVIVLATLVVIGTTGKPRKPLSPSDAVAITLLNAAVTVILVLAALRLGV
jgi:hypothetical protein